MDVKLEKGYGICREEMWKRVGKQVFDGGSEHGGGVSWRAVEDRVWELGKKRFVKK
jgi:hypothetical protein